MTRSILYALLIVLCLSTYISCTDNEYDILLGRIESISVPDTVRVNHTFEISTSFSGGTNGCAIPSHVEINHSEENAIIAAYYKVPREEVACTMVIPSHHLKSELVFSSTGKKTLQDVKGSVVKEILVIE